MSDREADQSVADVATENGELPEGWASEKIGKLFETWGGATPSTSEPRYWNGDIPWISSKDVKETSIAHGKNFVTADALAETRLRLCPTGSVLLVVRSGILAHTLPVALTTNEVVINQDLKALHSPDWVVNEWLALALRAEAPEILRANRKDGTTVQSIKFDELKNRDLRVPPLAEQKRIVAQVESLLTRASAARERLAKVPSLLARLRQSVLATACSGQLTAGWRDEHPDLQPASEMIERTTTLRKERYSQACSTAQSEGKRKPRNFDNYSPQLRHDLELFEIPDEWQWVDFRFVMDEQQPFCYGVVQPGANDPGGVYLIRAGDLDNGTVDESELRKIPASIDSGYERSRVQGGEILVTVVGANIGTVAIVPESCRGFNIARAIAKASIRDFDANYVLTWLMSSSAVGWMKEDSREVARPTLNLEQLRTLPIPLPPLSEQQEIVRRVESLFGLASVIERRLERSRAAAASLVQSILRSAFRGELVETEAALARREGRDYEPASELLKRIRAKHNADLSPRRSRDRSRAKLR